MLQKKLDALERDIDNFQNNIGELSAQSRTLVDKNHFDMENIKTQQVIVNLFTIRVPVVESNRQIKLLLLWMNWI